MGKWVVGFVCSVFLLSTGAQAETKVENILSLHKAEPYGATIFHDGLLWVGQSRTAIPYVLSVYGEDGTKVVSQVKLAHSVSYVYPYGANTVLVMGKTFTDGDGWRTYYSTVSYNAAKKRLAVTKTYKFGLKYQMDQFGGDPKRQFFSHPGDREVLTMGFWGPKRLNQSEVFGPSEMTLLGNNLFVVERPGVGNGNVANIDLATGKIERVFKNSVNSSLGHTTYLPALGLLAMSAKNADTVVFVNPKTTREERQVKVTGTPQGLAVFGSCLAVLRQSDRKITFLKTNSKDMTEAGEADISSGGYELSNPIYLAVNPATKTLFVRSIAPCLLCDKSQASVARVTVDDSIKKACQ